MAQLKPSSESEAKTVESTISMEIQLQPHENEFLADTGYYQIRPFRMTADNAEELCPTMNCQCDI